jgi:hypothetical protein
MHVERNLKEGASNVCQEKNRSKEGKQKHMHSIASFILIVLATKHYFPDLIQSQSLGVPFHTDIALDL